MNICKKCRKQIISLIPEEKCYCNETYATNHTELVYKEALNTFATVPYVNGHIRNFHKPYEEVRKDFKTLEEAISKAEKYDEKETRKKLVEKTKKILLGEEYYKKSYHCPSCDNEFLFEPINYCPNCGQKLDWIGRIDEKDVE